MEWSKVYLKNWWIYDGCGIDDGLVEDLVEVERGET